MGPGMSGLDRAGADLLAEARRREGLRRERIATEEDVAIFFSAVARYPAQSVIVYAGRGDYAPASQKFVTQITVLEWIPSLQRAVASECDARRPRGKGPWVTVDGKREV